MSSQRLNSLTFRPSGNRDFSSFPGDDSPKTSIFQPEIGLDSRKAAIFHSFFHRCGKLWGETKRA
jgi:hypothetical protein